MSEPIRLWLWRADGKTAGELVLQSDAEQPTRIVLQYQTRLFARLFGRRRSRIFWQDPDEGDMYRELP